MVTYIFRIYGRNKVPCCSFKFYIFHFTRLREKQRFQEDKSSNCVDYPTERFATYADCDIDFVRRNLPEGLAPFWAVDNVSLASNNWDKIKVNQSVIETLDWATQGSSYGYRILCSGNIFQRGWWLESSCQIARTHAWQQQYPSLRNLWIDRGSHITPSTSLSQARSWQLLSRRTHLSSWSL